MSYLQNKYIRIESNGELLIIIIIALLSLSISHHQSSLYYVSLWTMILAYVQVLQRRANNKEQPVFTVSAKPKSIRMSDKNVLSVFSNFYMPRRPEQFQKFALDYIISRFAHVKDSIIAQ